MAVNTIQELIDLLNEIDSDAQSLQYITNDAADSTAHGPSAGLVTTRSGTNVKNVRKVIQDVEDGITTGIRPNIQDEGSTVIYGAGAINFIGGAVTVTDVGGTATVDISSSVTTIGTPTDNQIGVWTGSGTLEGDSNFVWDGSSLGVGTNTPNSPLHVRGSNSGATGSGTLIVEQGSSPQINVISAATQLNTIAFGDPDDNDVGRLVYSHASDFMSFWTAATERMRIDSSGNLGIGTTIPSYYSGKLTVAGNIAISGGNRALFWNTAGSGVASIEGVGTNELAFMTSGSYTERMRIDSSGNVGVGTTSPIELLNIKKVNDGGTARLAVFENAASLAGSQSQILLSSGGNTSRGAAISSYNESASGQPASLIFSTSAAYATPSERMRIDSSGYVLIGTTSANILNADGIKFKPGGASIFESGDGSGAIVINRLTSDGTAQRFLRANVLVGSISVTGSATSYNTSSDARLKENIQDAKQAGETIDAIRVVQHDWKADGSHVDFGFIAQELNEVYPNAVTVPDDPEEMQSVDYSKLVPVLLKGLQEARQQIKELQDRLDNQA